MPTETEGIKRVCVIGGGLGTAIAYPVAKGFHDAGAETDVIVGFRNKDLVILEDDFRKACDNFYIMTDERQLRQRKGLLRLKKSSCLRVGKNTMLLLL